jgi:glycerophosphoryl diester phosphodiesterase
VRLSRPPWIVAHRGALPQLENTIPALLQGVAEGADMLEFDVRATADGALVLAHDSDLGRLAARPDLVVEQATLSELEGLELRRPGMPSRTGRLPTLAALLAALPERFPLNVELKSERHDRGDLAALALQALGGRPNVLFSSFDGALLREIRRRSPSASLAPIAERWTPFLAAFGREIGAFSLHVAHGVDEAVEYFRAAATPEEGGAGPAFPILVFTVNDAAAARDVLARGASGLFSDRPGPLRAELGAPAVRGV